MELEINETYVRHLQDLVRIPTLSSTNDEKTDWSQFQKLHACLEQNYPLIHQKLTKTVIGHGSLLFCWKAKKARRLPLLFMAHQDVVPAGDPAKWTHPPFAADLADGCLWGRGTTDCKSILMSELEAVESLLAEGWEPDFDLYLAFGHNEEIHAAPDKKGALLIAKCLKEQGIRLGCLFDEGGDMECGADLGYDGDIAFISLGEKSSNDYLLYADGPGGHSSMPGKGTVVGSLARAIAAIEAHPFPYRLTELAEKQLQALSSLQKGERKTIFADPKGHWEALQKIAREEKDIDSILHTTCAVTVISGGEQSNVLPSHAEATVNCRILQGDTAASVLAYLKGLLPEGVEIRLLHGEDPAPASSADSPEYRLWEETVKSLYGDNTIIMPALLAGGTDARNYASVCSQIFRFGGMYWTREWGAAHQVDEKIPINVLATGVKFFRAIAQAYNTLPEKE